MAFYNGAKIPEDCRRPDVAALAAPFMEIADQAGSAKAGNMIMLGAFLERFGGLPEDCIEGALRRLVKSDRWMEVDRAALARGRQIAKEAIHA